MTYDIRKNADGTYTVEIYKPGHQLVRELGPFATYQQACKAAEKAPEALSQRRQKRKPAAKRRQK